jgi:hypothetical protein
MVVMAKVVKQEPEVQKLIDEIAYFENYYGIDLEDYEPELKDMKKA